MMLDEQGVDESLFTKNKKPRYSRSGAFYEVSITQR
jgi:hypothetical protein